MLQNVAKLAATSPAIEKFAYAQVYIDKIPTLLFQWGTEEFIKKIKSELIQDLDNHNDIKLFKNENDKFNLILST